MSPSRLCGCIINSLLCFSLSFDRNHASVLTSSVATFLESHYAVYQCVKSVVLAHAYVSTGIVNRTTLAHDDVASHALLSTVNLHAQSF